LGSKCPQLVVQEGESILDRNDHANQCTGSILRGVARLGQYAWILVGLLLSRVDVSGGDLLSEGLSRKCPDSALAFGGFLSSRSVEQSLAGRQGWRRRFRANAVGQGRHTCDRADLWLTR
jgi:hypothetical protein